MTTFETSAIVAEHGRILVAGVPFAPGTEVEILMTPKTPLENELTLPDDATLAAARDRMRELFGTVKGFRMMPRIPREELYERGHLR